jgi:hypothetical protein|tara:strand:+ start:227 stop:736 length:510 start_codon:yes stop_codon:yes gene_type:complete
MTPTERKEKVAKLREEHEDYFQKSGNINALYIPKMAYRPSGKDELHVSFFPSELGKEKDIYTEFVSIDYETEDPKRTLYLIKHNPHWKEEYELITSNSGFERHIIPVSELKVINDVVSRENKITTKSVEVAEKIFNNMKIPNPETERSIVDVLKGIEKALLSINQKLDK